MENDEQQVLSYEEVDEFGSNRPRFLGWFLGSLSAFLLLSVFYVGDIIGNSYYQIVKYQSIVERIDRSTRPDLDLSEQVLAHYPVGQALLLKRVAGLYEYVEKGEISRAEEVLLRGKLPEVSLKYKLAAVLSWIMDNEQRVTVLKQRKSAAQNSQRELLSVYGDRLDDIARESEKNYPTFFPEIIGFDTALGNRILAVYSAKKTAQSVDPAIALYYLSVVRDLDEQSTLLFQGEKRTKELQRMAKEKAKELLKLLAQPEFDERSESIYREASIHSKRLGWSLPQRTLL